MDFFFYKKCHFFGYFPQNLKDLPLHAFFWSKKTSPKNRATAVGRRSAAGGRRSARPPKSIPATDCSRDSLRSQLVKRAPGATNAREAMRCIYTAGARPGCRLAQGAGRPGLGVPGPARIGRTTWTTRTARPGCGRPGKNGGISYFFVFFRFFVFFAGPLFGLFFNKKVSYFPLFFTNP